MDNQQNFANAIANIRKKRKSDQSESKLTPLQAAIQKKRMEFRERQVVGGEPGSAAQSAMALGATLGGAALEALTLPTTGKIPTESVIGGMFERGVVSTLGSAIAAPELALERAEQSATRLGNEASDGGIGSQVNYGIATAFLQKPANVVRGITGFAAPGTPAEGFARGLQESTSPRADTPLVNIASAVTQGALSVGQYAVASAAGAPVASQVAFFLEGAGGAMSELNAQYIMGKLPGQKPDDPYSLKQQYAVGVLGGAIESLTETVGSRVITGIGKRTVGKLFAGKGNPVWQLTKAAGAAYATEAAEEGLAEIGQNLKGVVTGQPVSPFAEMMQDAAVASLYGGFGGLGGAGVSLPFNAARQAAERNRLNESLRASQTEYKDPTFWDKVAPTKIRSMLGMTEQERMDEAEASRVAALQARTTFATYRNQATETALQLDDAKKSLRKLAKSKNQKARDDAKSSVDSLQSQLDAQLANLDVLAADSATAEVSYLAAVAFIARQSVPVQLSVADTLAQNGATMSTVQQTEVDKQAERELSRLGYDVVFYEDSNDDRLGFFDPATPNTIFIKSGQSNLSEIIGVGYEEAMHGIQLTDGALWSKLRQMSDEQGVIEAAVGYFTQRTNAQDIVARQALSSKMNPQQTALTAEQAIANRFGGALTVAEGTANDLRYGIETLFKTGKAPGLLGSVIARMGLRGRQAATAFKIRHEILRAANRRAAPQPTEFAATVREAQAGAVARQAVREQAEALAQAPTVLPAIPGTAPSTTTPAPVPTSLPARKRINDVFADAVSVEEAQARLRRKLARDPSVGQQNNQRQSVTVTLNGQPQQFVTGRITPQDWWNNATKALTQKEITDARGWYKELADVFVPVYGDKAATYMVAWLMSQQRASPTKGFADVLRAAQFAAGRPVFKGKSQRIKRAGLGHDRLIAVLSDRFEKSGLGAKLMDFYDSARGSKYRTVMRRAAQGGRPAAIDVWAHRDLGYVDPIVRKWLKSNGVNVSKIVEDKSLTSETKYERQVDQYAQITDWLNSNNIDNGKWSPEEAQAVGWIATQKWMGGKAEFINNVIAGNTQRISIGLSAGKGSPLANTLGTKELDPKVVVAEVKAIAQEFGVTIVKADIGVGAYLQEIEGSIQVDAVAIPESIQDMLDAIGYAFQQTEVIGSKRSKAGTNTFIDVYHPSFASAKRASAFFKKYLKVAPKYSGAIKNVKLRGQLLAAGFQQVNNNGKPAIRIANLGGKWTRRQVELIHQALKAAAQTHLKASDIDVEVGDAILLSSTNDWTKNRNGERYVDSLLDRRRLREARWLVDRYVPQRVDLLDQSTIAIPSTRQRDAARRIFDRRFRRAEQWQQGVRSPDVRAALGLSARRRDGGVSDRVEQAASGALSPLAGAPRIDGFTGPDPNIVAIAKRYAAARGIAFRRQSKYAEVDVARAERIAAAYAAMKHDPSDPQVAQAYKELIEQTRAQYDALVEGGYQFYFVDLENDPYASQQGGFGNPFNAVRDLRANKRMAVYPTESGFGSGVTDVDVSNSPLLADTGLQWPYGSPTGQLKRVTANDLFRAVHDAFGHSLEGAGFRARGEENAWQAHVRLFTGAAVGAMTSETRGQNSWLNYGPYGAQNREAKIEATTFADQKVGLMPSWTWSEGVVADEPSGTSLSARQRAVANAPASAIQTQPLPAAFYSALNRAIDSAPDKSMKPDSWRQLITSMVNKGEIKSEEVFWSGLQQFIDLLDPDVAVSKAEIRESLGAGGVSIRLVQLDDPRDDVFQNNRSAYLPPGYQITFVEEDEGYFEVRDAAGQVASSDENDAVAVQTAWESYSADERAAGRTPVKPTIGVALYGPSRFPTQTLRGGKDYREMVMVFDRRPKGVGAPFRESHHEGVAAVAGSEVLLHYRVTTRVVDGKRYLFVEELQSDYGQKGRKRGFKQPGDTDSATVWQSLETEIDQTSKELAQAEAAVFAAADAAVLGSNPKATLTSYWKKRDSNDVFIKKLEKHYARTREGLNPVEHRQLIESWADAYRASTEVKRKLEVGNLGLARGPMVTSTDAWVTLGLKQILMQAVNEGYDGIAFINGRQEAKRNQQIYQLPSITYLDLGDGLYDVQSSNDEVEIGTIADIKDKFGSALADMIKRGEGVRAEDSDLTTIDTSKMTFGTEAMEGFYEGIVPKNLKKLVSKLGGPELGTITLSELDNRPSIRESEDADGATLYTVVRPNDTGFGNSFTTYRTLDAAQRRLDELQKTFVGQPSPKQLALEITDALETNVRKGLSLFARRRIKDAQAGLAFQMGRRSGQVAGMMRGRVEGIRVGETRAKREELAKRLAMRSKFAQRVSQFEERIENAAQTNADLRQRLNDMRASGVEKRADLMDRARVRVLRAWFAGQQTGSRAGYQQAKDDMVAMRKDANKIIGLLPPQLRGKYLNAAAEMRTVSGIDRIARRVVRDLHVADALDTVRMINGMIKRVKKAGLRNETRDETNRLLFAAKALLVKTDRRLLPFDTSADLANRITAATDLMEQAMVMYDTERAEYRDNRDSRALEFEDDAANLTQTLSSLEGLAPEKLTGQAPRPGLLSRIVSNIGNADIYTIMHRLEGGENGILGKVWSNLLAGKDAMVKARRSIDSRVDTVLRQFGFDGYDGYIARAAGLYGDATAESVDVVIGGESRAITIDQMMHLAALDPETVDLLRDENDPESPASPIVFSTYRYGDPLYLTQQEHAAIVANLSPAQSSLIAELKNLLDTQVQPQLFEIHFQNTGRQPPQVDGYFPRPRLGDEVAGELVDVNLQPGAVVTTMLTNAGMLQKRVRSRAPLVIGGMLRTFDSHVDEALRVIHMSSPLRHAITVLRRRGVRSNIERIMGAGGNDAIRKLVMNGAGISGRPTGDLMEIVNSNMSGSLLLLNPKTWLRQMGGVFRLASEFPAQHWAAGMVRASALTPGERSRQIAELEGESGYFYERHRRSQVGLFANVLGDPRTGRERWAAAVAATGRALQVAGQDAVAGQWMRAASDVQQGIMSIGKLLRTTDFALRGVDRQVMLVAYNAALSEVDESGVTGSDRITAAARLAERSFRRTQNVSDPLDDTVFAASQKFARGLGRFMFPFSSDPLKGYNQLRRAFSSGDVGQMAKTSGAIAGNIALSAAVNPLWAAAAYGISQLFDSGDDDEAVQEMLVAREGQAALRRVATDTMGTTMGFVGLLAAGIIEGAMGSPMYAGDVGEPLAVRALGDIAQAVSAGKWGRASGVLLQAAGVPVIIPIGQAVSAVESVSPDRSKLISQYRKMKSEGRISPAQSARLRQLEQDARLEKIRQNASQN